MWLNHLLTCVIILRDSWSRWPRGRSRRSAAALLLESRVRIPLRACTFVSCVCCVLCRSQPQRRADHSFRGVLPGVSNCVWSRNLCSEAAWARLALLRHRGEIHTSHRHIPPVGDSGKMRKENFEIKFLPNYFSILAQVFSLHFSAVKWVQ
jgi:hypothetical protein